jgi:RND family efflux transporter MFP subunit
MTTRKKWMLALAAVLVAAVLIVVAMDTPGEQEGAAADAAQAAPNPDGEVRFLMEQQWRIRLKLAKAEPAMVAPQILSTGRVVPAAHNQALIAPPVGGIIGGANFPRVGQRVQRGQVLATLTQTPTAAESAQIRVENLRLEAERRRLANAVRESQIQRDLAETEFERARRLYEKKAYSLKQLQIAEAGLRSAEANLAGAAEQLNALEMGEAAVVYPLRAPIAGTVVAVHKAFGEQVNPGEAAFEVVNLDTVWVEVPIFERDLGRLQVQSGAVFTTASFPDTEFRGKLIDIGAVIHEQTRAATVRLEVPNPSNRLRIGMQANVRLEADSSLSALLIPREAVLDNEGEKIVYVLLSGETFQRRTVQVGDEYGDKVAILSGVMAGERVVTQGAYQLKLQELRPADAGAHTHEI